MGRHEVFSSVEKELVCGGKAPFACCHASNVAALGDGSVMCAWFAGSKEGADDVNIWGSRKRGGTWDPPRVIAKDDERPLWNPILFERPDGSVVLFYKVGRKIDSWQTLVSVSGDGGLTWSCPRELVEGDVGGRGPVRNKVITLSSGRILAPASREDGEWRCFADRSDDGGRTWQRSDYVRADLRSAYGINPDFRSIPVSEQSFSGRGVIQPTLWESAPRRAHMLMRSSEGRAFRSDSNDDGVTWCDGYATSLPNNNSGLDLVKVPDVGLFLVYNPVAMNWGERTPLRLAYSGDNGLSWCDTLTLEDSPGEYSYPSIVYRDRCLFVTYTHDRKDIAFWKLRLA